MVKLTSNSAIYVLVLLCAFATNNASGEEKDVITRDALNLTVPNPFGKTPIFETNDQNGRLIGIHIPFLLDLELHFRDNQGLAGTKLKLTLVSGMLRANFDRVKLADGKRHGPLQFSLLGVDLYDNKENPYAK